MSMNYEDWYEQNEVDLYAEWMESGASGELDNNFETFCEDKFEKEESA